MVVETGDVVLSVRRQFPHLKKVFPLLDQLMLESPRGRVLISCGFLEELLRQILEAYLIPGTQSDNLLKGPNAPLGTFSARISAASALGLLTEIESNELTLLRRIRNDFAHDFEVSFETPKIAGLCDKMRLCIMATKPDEIIDESSKFSTSAVTLIMRLVNRAVYVGQERRVVREWKI